MYSNYQKYLIASTIFFWNVIFPNFIFQDYSVSNLRNYEINSILDSNISSSLYNFTNIPVQTFSKITSYDFLYSIKNLDLNPVLGLRYSTAGFEMNTIESPAQTIWITPGVQFNYITPIISPYSGYLFQAWGSFYKHSAYFLDKSVINKGLLTNQELKPFEYNPYLSLEYYVQAKEPEWGVDFDEAQGGLGILSNNFKLNFGKFKSSLVPFHR